MAPNLPDRYGIEYKTFEGNQHKAIFRRDHLEKGNRLLMVRGLSRSRQELEDENHPHDHIFLDGAARGPFYDKKRGIFSLDHHEDCVRQITDSTCVQATSLARTRIITALGNTIIGNDPDADTVFGSWALMNADLIAHDERLFKRIQPLMIVEGNIDSYGFGYEELTGLPSETISETRQRIHWLMQDERDLKQRNRWSTIDYIDFTENALRKIDRYALFRDSSDMPAHMDVHKKTPLRNGQSVHFVQAPDSGIYEVEYTILSHQNDKDCACIIFHDGKSKWTIKLSGFVNDLGLVKVSEALNKVELQIKQTQRITDQKMLDARWGGGNTIIGAPRYPKGNAPFISNQQIIEIVVSALNEQIGE